MLNFAPMCRLLAQSDLASWCLQRHAEYPLMLISAQGARAQHGCRICSDTAFHVYLCSLHTLCSLCIEYACIQIATTHNVPGVQHMQGKEQCGARTHAIDNGQTIHNLLLFVHLLQLQQKLRLPIVTEPIRHGSTGDTSVLPINGVPRHLCSFPEPTTWFCVLWLFMRHHRNNLLQLLQLYCN